MDNNKLSDKAFQSSEDPRGAFGDAFLAVASTREEIVAVSTDSSSGSGFGKFAKAFPGRHVEFGIMEQGAVGFSAGMASTGLIPFYAAIAPFVTARPYEMFKNDLGYMNQNVKVVGRCCGLTYSQLGPTHHSLDDVALIGGIPGVRIFNPGDPVSIRKLVQAMADIQGPCYLKIGSPPMPVLYDEDINIVPGKGIIIRDGRDVTLIGTGTALANTVKAADILEKKGISVRLVDIHTIKPLDRDLILDCADSTGGIVTVEEHYIHGGLGSSIASLLVQTKPVPMDIIAIEDLYASNGPYEELLGLYGLLPEQIAGRVELFVKEKLHV